ncbi:hypothetical protein [Mycoplasma sp. ATU-Cv-508]|uniref:hypothetical protein n=1 Tax=Mycoplasma sp. ATU-Cv-508 TaxID=2048001 RepID=UPI000FDD2A8C
MLGIDALVLRGVWKDLPLSKQTFTSLKPEVGTIGQLGKLIRLFQDKGIKVLLEISLAGIDPRHIFCRPTSERTVKEQDQLARHGQLPTREQYLLGDLTTDVVLNQQRENFLSNLTQLINYWNKHGLAGLVVSDFEQLFDFKKTAIMGEQTKAVLKRIYTIVKMVSDQFLWIGMAHMLSPEQIRTQNPSHDPLFDYLGTYDFSLLGKDHAVKTKAPKVKFTPHQYVKLARSYIDHRRGLHALSSHLAGRIISRWASDYAYHSEAARVCFFCSCFTPDQV